MKISTVNRALTSTLFLSLLLFSGLAKADSTIAFSGDFRFRTETVKDEQASPLPTAEQNRQRLRLRLSANAKINEETNVIIRLATGTTTSTGTTSTNQTLTDYYSKKSFVLDMAYFNWKASDVLTVLGGKMLMPFYSVGSNDVVFDVDLTPEGLALKYSQTFDTTEVFFNTSGTWIQEQYSATGAADNTDIGLIGAQLGANYKATAYNILLVASSYNFSNIKGSAAPAARGNTVAAGLYTLDYKLTSVGLEVGTKFSGIPFVAYADSITNSDGGDYKTANIYGVKLGKLKEKGSWALSLDQREIKKDALLGVFTDADSTGGGSDINGLKLTAGYQLAQNSNVYLNYLTGKRAISADPSFTNTRFQLDFSFMF